MPVPASQAAKVATYVLSQKLKGNKHYPLVLMLEPLFRCNLRCQGCGKIQYPAEILKKHVSAEEAWAVAKECGAPIVSIAGGEPLMHPEIKEIVEGLIRQGRYVYLCTNAILLERSLDKFTPDKHLSFSVHLDGKGEEHDKSVCRAGTYEAAIGGIREALKRGFRVTTNTTIFNHADPEKVREFFDELMELGIEGMMLSPGYPYGKAPNQEIFLERNRTKTLFKKIFQPIKKSWHFNLSPLFVQFLQGKIDFDCSPWGNPTYNIFGWQTPCYLLQDGHFKTYKELIEKTEWKRYGQKGSDERCKDCMLHSGYEASSVNYTFGSPIGMAKTIKYMINPNAK